MDTSHVVTCFLEQDHQILLLKRSGRVGSYQQRWAGVSGYIEPGVSPVQQALQELNEELGLDPADIKLLKEGNSLEVVDDGLEKTWVVHPFRFQLVSSKSLRLDWENTESRWIDPANIGQYTTVPNLREAWENVK